MSRESPQPSIPAAALRAFAQAERADWSKGVPLEDLLDRVNRVAGKFLPAGETPDSRVSREFTPRSFRHYQTLGCIDEPERDGKQVVYDFRHLVQALLVRRLLWGRVPSEQIVAVMAGRSKEETKRMLLGGISIVARAEGTEGMAAAGADGLGPAETWKRIQVAPGVELHLRGDRKKPKPGELKQLLERLEAALRRGG